MKKNLKYLLIGVIVLAVLAGVVLAVTLFPSGQGDSPSETSSTAPQNVVFTDRSYSDVSAMDITSSAGDLHIVAAPEDNTSGRDFLLEAYEQYDLNTIALDSAVHSLFSCTNARELGAQSDLESFGLSGENAAKVSIDYKDGSHEDVVIGIRSAESIGRYLLRGGQVYIVSALSDMLYQKTALNFILTTGLVAISDRVPDEEEGLSELYTEDVISKLQLSGENYPAAIEIVPDSTMLSGYRITEPVTAESGNTAFMELRDSLKSISAYDVVDVGDSDEILEQYGLKTPFARVSYVLNGEEHTISVSAVSGGYRYMTVDDRGVIYRVAREDVQPWAESSLQELRMSYVMVAMIYNVENLRMNWNGQVYDFHIDRTYNEERSETTGTDTYDLSITNDKGEPIEYENYQNFYSTIMGLPILNSQPVDFNEKDLVFTLTYEYFDGGSDTVKFYTEGTGRYNAVLNGKSSGVLRSAEADKAFALLPKLYAGETVEKKK